MSEDFYLESAKRRLQILEASRSRAQADLAEARASGDYDSASDSIQTIANIDAQKANLIGLHNQYVQQQNHVPPPSTEAEFMARSPERMGPEDVDRIFSKSKYYTKGQWGDPEVNRRAQEGLAEVERRRREGR